jgi:hypothetical protein
VSVYSSALSGIELLALPPDSILFFHRINLSGGILLGGITAVFIPAIKAYRNSLQDGLTTQV